MSSKQNWARLAAVLGVVIIAALIPVFHLGEHVISIFINMFIYIILATSMALMVRVGLVNTAHAALAGIGAYASALLVMRGGLSFWLSLPSAALASAALGFLIGCAALLKVKGPYFFVITMGFAEIIRLALGSIRRDILGGPQGIIGVPSPSPLVIPGVLRIEFTSRTSLYYLGLVVVLLSVLIIYQISRSRYGRTFKAIGESDFLAESLGVNLFRFKMYAFVVSSFFAGVAGTLYAHSFYVITPDDFSMHNLLIPVVVFLVVGGTGSFVGPLIGVCILTLISELMIGLREVQSLVYGIAVIAVMLSLRGGLISAPRLISAAVARSRRASSQ